MSELRDIDGNGHVPIKDNNIIFDPGDLCALCEEESHRRVCELCQKERTAPQDIAMFSRLLSPGGKSWDICGKCISVMWRKRQPKLAPIEMLCA